MVSCSTTAALAQSMPPEAAAVALVMFVEHEKKTFFSWLVNSRSEAVSQGRPKGAA
jgi:hypothetical protein